VIMLYVEAAALCQSSTDSEEQRRGAESRGGEGYQDWFTVTVWPAIVKVPDRVPPGYATNVTVPLPVPLAPRMISIQLARLVAVHEHPLPVVTSTERTPPNGKTDNVVSLTE
jgi:hypothetical protein